MRTSVNASGVVAYIEGTAGTRITENLLSEHHRDTAPVLSMKSSRVEFLRRTDGATGGLRTEQCVKSTSHELRIYK